MSLHKIFLPILFYSLTSQASDLALRTNIEERNNLLTGSFENTSFSTAEGTVSGMGIRAAFNHWITDTYGVEFAASVALNNQNSVQSNSFTGFNAFAYYNVWGTPYSSVKKVFMGDHLVASEKQPLGSSLFLGLGVSQYFLNGNRGVYSASGLGFGAGYMTHLFGADWRVSVRWNQLQASQHTLDGMSYDMGLVFSL